MGDLTKNISRHEVKCKCEACGCSTIDYLTACLVQECVDHFSIVYSRPVFIHILSGHRCEYWNQHERGADDSQHLYGRALDFYLYYLLPNDKRIIPPSQVYAYLDHKYRNKFGVGKYSTYTHFDTKTGPERRW